MAVLPPAFPYGGMENPNLTFLSSSLLAGDRSLTNVVAHEITHSWSGNLVTNATWSDFWLNEGFTVYIERLILGRVMGSVQYRHFEIMCGYNVLKKTVAELKDHPEFTKLVPNLDGIDPDEAFSRIPYDKGSLFLFYLETLVGGPEQMQKWLKTYFTDFSGKSIRTQDMINHFIKYFPDLTQDQIASFDVWLYGTGMPPFDPTPYLDTTIGSDCIALARSWIDNHGVNAQSTDLDDFRSKQKMFFLDEIINSVEGLDHETLDRMNQIYNLSDSSNVEIKFRWLQLCLKNGYNSIIPHAADFLSKHGRGLYVKPLYKLLNKTDHEIATQIYNQNRSFYHSVIRSIFDKEFDY